MSEVAEPSVKRVKLAGDEEGQGTAETSKEAEKVGSDLQFSYLSLSCKTKGTLLSQNMCTSFFTTCTQSPHHYGLMICPSELPIHFTLRKVSSL